MVAYRARTSPCFHPHLSSPAHELLGFAAAAAARFVSGARWPRNVGSTAVRHRWGAWAEVDSLPEPNAAIGRRNVAHERCYIAAFLCCLFFEGGTVLVIC